MDNVNFWLWTLFFVLLSIFVIKFICLCSSYNERNDYIGLLKKPIPLHTYKTSHIVNKIDSEKV